MVSPENLRRYPAFAGATEEGLRAVAMTTERKSYEADEAVFADGEQADHLFIVVAGEVDIRHELGSGEQRVVDTLVAGDLLGWSAVVTPFRMTANAVTRVPTELLIVDARTLRQCCEADTVLGYNVMTEVAKVMSHRLQGARVQLATVA